MYFVLSGAVTYGTWIAHSSELIRGWISARILCPCGPKLVKGRSKCGDCLLGPRPRSMFALPTSLKNRCPRPRSRAALSEVLLQTFFRQHTSGALCKYQQGTHAVTTKKYYRNISARAHFCGSFQQIIRALQNGAVQSKNNYAVIRYCNILLPVSLVTVFWENTFFVQNL